MSNPFTNFTDTLIAGLQIFSDDPAIAVDAAIGAGVTDKNELTNWLFFREHPELNGRPLEPKRPEDAPLIRRWRELLETIVLPALAAASAPEPGPADDGSQPAWLQSVPRRTATTRTAKGTTVWRREADVAITGYGVPPRHDPGAPYDERRAVEFVYVEAGARAAQPTSSPIAVAACRDIDGFRARIPVLDELKLAKVARQSNSPGYVMRGYFHAGRKVALTTSLTAQESFNASPIDLPASITREALHRARLDVWHAITNGEGNPSSINAYDVAGLTLGGGFAAAGQLQKLLAAACARSPVARSLLERAGLAIRRFKETGHFEFVAVDTTRRWQLVDDDAVSYIRADPRLLSLFGRIAAGTVPAELLGADAAARNQRLREAMIDAQFVQLVNSTAQFDGAVFGNRWTPTTRSAVAHSIHAGGLKAGFWQRAGRESDGSPSSVLKLLVDAWLGGKPGTIDARKGKPHHGRVLGAASHRAFEAVLSGLPATNGQAGGQLITYKPDAGAIRTVRVS